MKCLVLATVIQLLWFYLNCYYLSCSPSSKVWHRCRFKPPNCCLARAARVVCAQPGTVVCSQTPLSLVVCWSGGGGGLLTCWFKSNCIDIKAWLDHHSLLLVAQIKLTLKYLSIRYILQITRHGIISTNFYLFKPPACSIFQDGGIWIWHLSRSPLNVYVVWYLVMIRSMHTLL